MLTDKCDENAICTDTPDSYECTCKEGYIGNGTTCEGQSQSLALIRVCHHRHFVKDIPNNLFIVFLLSVYSCLVTENVVKMTNF